MALSRREMRWHVVSPRDTNTEYTVSTAMLVASLGLKRAKPGPLDQDGVMTEEDYISLGKASNNGELSADENPNSALFRGLEEEEGFGPLFEVPFGLKHVKDLDVVMRHAIAVMGERHEDLLRHPLFHPAFAAFTLGFSIGLAEAHRSTHTGFRGKVTRLNKRQLDSCNTWGVEVATYYLAAIDADGIFGKDADRQLYGIGDKWRLLADERRLEPFQLLRNCVTDGKCAGHLWFADETADVLP